MTTQIKAIETVYKGYRFRSRLEARWAVFFDELNLKWEYEKEGYVLPDGTWYLPDFWIKSYPAWAEIKPSPDDLIHPLASEEPHDIWASDEFKRCDALSIETGFPALLVIGLPGSHRIACSGFESEVQHLLHCWKQSKRYEQAITAARSARFEHGENGAPK